MDVARSNFDLGGLPNRVNHTARSGLLAYLGAQFACPPQATKSKRDLQISARKVIQFSSEVCTHKILPGKHTVMTSL